MYSRITNFLATGALICTLTEAQNIAPAPRTGSVIWTKRLEDNHSAGLIHLTPDEAVLIAASEVDGQFYVPTRVKLEDLSIVHQKIPPDAEASARLRGNGVTLSDGSLITQSGAANDQKLVESAGLTPWSFKTSLFLGRLAGTAHDDLIGAYSKYDGWRFEDFGMIQINGKRGDHEFHPFGKDFHIGPFLGFAPQGCAVYLAPESLRFHLTLVDSRTGSVATNIAWGAADWKPYTVNGSPIHMVCDTRGRLLIAAEGPSKHGLIVVDATGGAAPKILALTDHPLRVAGLAVGRDGFIYCSLSERSAGGNIPPVGGGVCRVNPDTGEYSLLGNVTHSVESPPIITRKGELIVLSNPGHTTGVATLVAIATRSVGGLAETPWPRSTGDNQNSFREHSVIDTDGDGLTDADESVNYKTDPVEPDTDADGYTDFVEAVNGSNPLSSEDIPIILEALPAIKLTFGTSAGQWYQLQTSADLAAWTDVGSPFAGTGVKQSQLVETGSGSKYWRLKRAE